MIIIIVIIIISIIINIIITSVEATVHRNSFVLVVLVGASLYLLSWSSRDTGHILDLD